MTINHITATALLLLCSLSSPSVSARNLNINDSGWNVSFDVSSRTLMCVQNGKTLLKGIYMLADNANDVTLNSKDYPLVSLTSEGVSDKFGTGRKYVYTYSGLPGKENMEQVLYIYPDKGFMLVEGDVVATTGTTKTNYIAPIVTAERNVFLPAEGRNFVYDMPFDNDNWAGYSAKSWRTDSHDASCEVSAFYDVVSRAGLIIGSVEHDNWKSGITAKTDGKNVLDTLTVAAGVVGKRTNDVWRNRPKLTRHGYISGNSVRSPRYFLGYYSDWRDGLEALGDATATLEPKLPWTGGTIFGWQSWGGMAHNVNYEGAMDVSDFFHGKLMPNKFHNENGVCYMVLDSGWDNLTDEQLRNFVRHCNENGQQSGIYSTPFSYWGSDSDAYKRRPYPGSPYTWADMALRAHGELRGIESIALDPTHPGTIEYNRRRFAKFKEMGFKYVKLDFLSNGALEADHYYAPGVTTGMQAYTYGMDKVLEQAKDMFVDLSIAPIFPAKGNARRISCDSWGELNNSMYSLNSMELGWWFDRVYDFNDPDHLVLSRAGSDGAARVRYTCGVMSGTMLLGDNYSLKGTFLGKQSERDLATRIATNDDVNAVARLGRSFRPVEGGLATKFHRYEYQFGVDNEFTLDTGNALYYIVFNFDTKNDLTKRAKLARIGIVNGGVKVVKELWTGASASVDDGSFVVSVPKCDVRIYRISKFEK